MPPSKILIKTSAPGKIILHGEHSVVYGKLAIAASLDLRTTISIEERINNKLEVNFIDLKFKKHFSLQDIKLVFEKWDFPLALGEVNKDSLFLNPESLDHEAFIQLIKTSLNISEENLDKNKFLSLISLLYLYFGIVYSSKISIEALYISVKTDLSLGSGTGSSASLMVSLSSAFLQYLIIKNPDLKQKFEINESKPYENFNEFQLKLISKWAFRAEKIIHGNPSGIDNTVCTYGSLVSFRKGRAPFAVKCNREIKGLIVDTKVPKNTAVQVQKVADLKKRHPKIVESILESLESVADESLDFLIQLGDITNLNSVDPVLEGLYRNLGELSSINHNLLQALGVSHPVLDETVLMMAQKGLKGKLTGAGGGGYTIALIPPFICVQDCNDLCTELQAKGYKGMIIKLGSTGVRFEK